MGAQQPGKWYFSTATLVAGFLCLGPLILPLVWFNPRFTVAKKALLSAVIIVLSVLLWAVLARSVKSIGDYYKILDDIIKQSQR